MFLKFVTLLLACQLAGEAVALATGIPVPGPVIGMALLFVGLMIRGSAPEGLQSTANGLLQHLSLLFVPAGVGVMIHLRLLQAEWEAVLVALIASTILTIAVTGLAMKYLMRLGGPKQ
ncbi:CidA/LrgA family protein [Magnetospira sp. QH-2]|uniref:CidA/LrgA family protein n=1 Tax=Magnetospira sp. (strain QH-2) TaxID=1288970 RepID=UPI0003E80A9B|nr:CidA/LrgA family protein [Magnetospira sp. QH-2]CCQ72252.1 Murein hydrolases export protein (LrgA, involved in penicillin tolerance) [Magnetospira sp. QH-2]